MIVLVVDDYPDALDVWEMFLTAAGYQVITALDGHEGLEKARTLSPDIAVLDLTMPGLSGIEMASALRADARTPLHEAHAAGFDALIVKPCDPDDLVREIRRLVPIAPAASSD